MKCYRAVLVLGLLLPQISLAANPEPLGRKTGLAMSSFDQLNEFELEFGAFSECLKKDGMAAGTEFTTCKVSGASFNLQRSNNQNMQVNLTKLLHFRFVAETVEDISESYQLSGDWNETINGVEILTRMTVYINKRADGFSGFVRSSRPDVKTELIFKK